MQPKHYSLEEHKIAHTKIDKHAYYVIQKLRANNFKAYLVGGSVRDLLLNTRPKDFDISTSAKPEEIKKIFKKNCILIGRRFRLAHIRFGKKILEVATFRAGDTEDNQLIIQDNIWGSPKEDVLRRDFTINGLLYDPEKEEIIDYIGGVEDAKKHLLRTIGTASVRFHQDPVRMIRLIKFIARFGFHIEEETSKALLECKYEIKKSSTARMFEEILKMLESGSSEKFFRLLLTYDFLSILMPNFASILKENQEIYKLLGEADIFVNKNHPYKPNRAFLLSCLLFFTLRQRLESFAKEQKRPIHLGIVINKTKDLILETFAPFFHLPKRTKAAIISILLNQFRFTPIDKTSRKKIRIPKDPFFPLAMQFFHLRCNLEPELFPLYTKWNEAIIASHKRKKRFPIKKQEIST